MTTEPVAEVSAPEAQAMPDAMDKIVNDAIEAKITKPEVKEVAEEKSESPEPKEDLWPKKAVNALSKAKAQVARERAIRQQYEKELETYRSKAHPQVEPQTKSDAPKESDFEGKPYGDYLDAIAEYKVNKLLEQRLSERDKKSSQEKEQFARKEWEVERDSHVDESGEKAAKDFADFDDVMRSQVAGKFLAEHVKDAIRDAENPAYALYALAKEDGVESLNELSPSRVGVILDRMAEKAMGLTKKTVTKAPTPMKANSGTSPSVKPITKLTPSEVLKWAES